MLDDIAALRALDRSGVLECLAKYARQFELGLRPAPGVSALAVKPRGVIVGGMGGSAVAGDIVKAWADHEGAVPVAVSRGYSLPAWADATTPFIAVSYSGSTSETLAQTAAALERGLPVVAVTSGGALAGLAGEHGAPVVDVPAGLPRGPGHVGYLIAGAVATLRGWGVAPRGAGYEEAVKLMAAMCAEWHYEVPETKNLAKQIARSLSACIPAVYGASPMGCVAARWANQMGENAKTVATWGEVPEADHNEIVGWEEDDRAKGYGFVVLREGTEAGEMARRIELTGELFERASGKLIDVQPRGDTMLARLMHHVCLGDWVSVYMAFARGHDPVPTPAIDRFKAALRDVGSRR